MTVPENYREIYEQDILPEIGEGPFTPPEVQVDGLTSEMVSQVLGKISEEDKDLEEVGSETPVYGRQLYSKGIWNDGNEASDVKAVEKILRSLRENHELDERQIKIILGDELEFRSIPGELRKKGELINKLREVSYVEYDQTVEEYRWRK